MGIIYVLTNPAFEDYVKVGRTKQLEKRLRSLDNTSVPLPFRCVFAIKVDDEYSVERYIHDAFADHRTRSNREFFEIDPQRIISALMLTNGEEVTPKDDVAKDEEGIEALERATTRRAAFKFSLADITVGSEIVFAKDSAIIARVVDDKKIEVNGKKTSLNQATLGLLKDQGYNWKSVQGPQYWKFGNETLSERRKRMEDASDQDDD